MAHVEQKDAPIPSGALATAGESLLARATELEQGGGLAEAERLLEQALEAGELPAEPRAAAMEAVGRVKLRLGDAGGACRWLEQALWAHERRRPQSREQVAWLHLVLAAAWRRAGEERRAESLARQARERMPEKGLLLPVAQGFEVLPVNASGALHLHGRQDLPASVRSEALRLLVLEGAERGDLCGATRAALLRVDVEGRQGAWERAVEAAKQALALARRAGEERLVAEAWRLYGDAHLHGSYYEETRLAYEEAIRRYEGLGDARQVARVRSLLVALLLQTGRLERLPAHAEGLRHYLTLGLADEQERRTLRELLALVEALP